MSESKRPILLSTSMQIADFEREPAHAFLEALRTHAELIEFQQQLSDTIDKAGATAEAVNAGLAGIRKLTGAVCNKYVVEIQKSTEEFVKNNQSVIANKDRQIAELAEITEKQKMQIDQLLGLASKKKWFF